MLILDGYFKHLDSVKQQRQAQGLERGQQGQKGTEFVSKNHPRLCALSDLHILYITPCPFHAVHPTNIGHGGNEVGG